MGIVWNAGVGIDNAAQRKKKERKMASCLLYSNLKSKKY